MSERILDLYTMAELTQDDIVCVDQTTNLSLKCPLCHRILRDPVVTQCGVSYFGKFILFNQS